MAGHLPRRRERSQTEMIESGYRLNPQQKLVASAWDHQILLLKLKGRSHDQISAEVGCSAHYVRKQIPKLLDAHARQFAEESRLEIVLQLASLDVLLSEVRLQWERSCLDHDEETTETEGGGKYKEKSDGSLESVPSGNFKQKSRRTRYGQTGDPRLVEQIRAIMADKRKLLRLDKDDTLQGVLADVNFTQININAGDGPMVPITAMTPQALAETAELLAALGMNPDGTPIKQKQLPADIDGDFVIALATEKDE